MGKPIDFASRQLIVKDCEAGLSYSEVSRKYTVRYNTVKNFHQRFLEKGMKGLQPHYFNCGKQKPTKDNLIYRTSCWLKHLHPQWGAPFILIKLKERYPEQVFPTARNLQRWFKTEGLNKVQGKMPKASTNWATSPHDTWQVDAKERIVIADGSKGCWLTVVDEKSGALLGTLVFPPQPYFTSSHNGNKDRL